MIPLEVFSVNSPSNFSSEPPLNRFFQNLPRRHRPERTVGWTAVVHFDIKEASQPLWTVTIMAGDVRVEEGHRGKPDCVVATSQSVFLELVTGHTSPELAFLSRKVSISRPHVMLRFLKAFDRAVEVL